MHSLLKRGGKVKMLKENMDALNKMGDIKDALFYRELNAKLIRENRELKADIKHDKLQADNVKAREYIVQVEKENDTLKYANTMFHAREWFNNNPKCNKVYVFVLDADGVNDDGWIADSHAVVSVNDGNCVGSYDRKVIDN